MISAFLQALADKSAVLLPALIGGVVDYLNQIQNGARRWSAAGMLVHLLSAVFFGWAVGVFAAELQYSADLVSVAGGAGGFLGVRVADLATYRLLGDRRAP